MTTKLRKQGCDKKVWQKNVTAKLGHLSVFPQLHMAILQLFYRIFCPSFSFKFESLQMLVFIQTKSQWPPQIGAFQGSKVWIFGFVTNVKSRQNRNTQKFSINSDTPSFLRKLGYNNNNNWAFQLKHESAPLSNVV